MFHQSLVRSWPLIACRKSCRKRAQEESGGNTEEVKAIRTGIHRFFKPFCKQTGQSDGSGSGCEEVAGAGPDPPNQKQLAATAAKATELAVTAAKAASRKKKK